ncbi:angiopoietin-1 receptor-like [Diadema antillarum]|uniref:angiopoietin-1 receptor-like n=1 Tax=Diadema antillarum TaxID=105358 RepID=UPI003A85F57A
MAVTTPLEDSRIFWRKNGGPPMEGSEVYRFNDSIKSSDAGIYEIYYNGTRHEGRGALYRLIVRDCSAAKWGPPACEGICDKCYNGGICNAQTGRCICPNNFRGPNCLNICREDGGNRFGFDCEYRCSYTESDRAHSCRKYLFCLPDPYGCSCETGVRGHKCSSVPDICDVGYYGPECIDKCYCMDDEPCDKITGQCSSGICAIRYGVFGNQLNCQECRPGFYGVNCVGECRCSDEVCDIETGNCTGDCLPNWLLPNCETGILEAIANEKVNPSQQSSFTCAVTGSPPPPATDVHFYRSGNGTLDELGIERGQVSLSASGLDRSIVFVVNQGVSIGDPPLTSYTVFLRNPAENWDEGPVLNSNVVTAALTELLPDTDYEASVAAAREGPGGIGPRSPVTQFATLCKVPDDVARCRSGVTSYVVYYLNTRTKLSASARTSNGSATELTLIRLEPYLTYEIQVATANKDGESSKSNMRSNQTLEEVAPPPIKVMAVEISAHSFKLTWEVASPQNLNGARRGFEIRYIAVAPEPWQDYEFELETKQEITLLNLSAQTTYTVEVRTLNGVGDSAWSSDIFVHTMGEVSDDQSSTDSTLGLAFGVVVTILFLGFCGVFIVFWRKRKTRVPRTVEEIAPNQSNNAYEEPVVCVDAPGIVYQDLIIRDADYMAVEDYAYTFPQDVAESVAADGERPLPADGERPLPADGERPLPAEVERPLPVVPRGYINVNPTVKGRKHALQEMK